MDITEIKINLLNSYNGDLRASCSIVFDNELVLQGVAVIEENGELLVRMPDREITRHCNNCEEKNSIHSNFCGTCGVKLTLLKPLRNKTAYSDFHVPIIELINKDLSELIRQKVLKVYQDKRNEKLKVADFQPG